MDSIRLTGIRAAAGQDGSPSVSSHSSHTGRSSKYPDVPRWRDLRADVTIALDLREAIADDDITETVDYAQLTDRVRQVMASSAYDCALLETIAGRIAQAVLLSHRVQCVDVVLHCGQPSDADVDEIAVAIHRLADDSSRDSATPAAQASGSMPRQGRGDHDDGRHDDGQRDGSQHNAQDDQAESAQTPMRQPSHAVIAMHGENGDGERLMRAAVVALDSVPGNQVTGISPLYHVSAIDGPDSLSAVVLVDTHLNLPALSHLLASINDKHRDTLTLRAVTMWSDANDGRHEHIGWQEAKTMASILAPWMDIEPDARFDGDPLSYLLALAPDATRVGLLSDSWIVGGLQ
ncbi:dihydroneopterin aldolase [Bifidobacterium apri]|uniref:dihydroneopterin aldolase n=1 Tax=Bifidobacterium apri TaxID=1769423 RepID=UPI00399146CC